MRNRVLYVFAAAPLLVGTVMAQQTQDGNSGNSNSASSQEPGITRQQADEMLKELREIRQLLERQSLLNGPSQAPQPSPTGKLKLEGGFSLGSNDAPLTMVEFTDYQCPFCGQFQNSTFAEIRKKYIDTGKVRFFVRDFPLEMHPDAMRAAEAAHCAGDQGRFWPMHEALFSDPAKLGQTGLLESAESLKLDLAEFRSCLESGKHKSDIQNDLKAVSSLQIGGTPAFLIGKSGGDELSGAIVIGAQPLSVFEAQLKEAEAAH